MRTWSWGLMALTLLAPATVRSQQPPPQDDAAREATRKQIEDRFAARVQEELGLSDDQAAKMRVTASTYFAKRRTLEQNERKLRQALAGQLRPGVAANQDSVSRLVESMLQVREKYLQTFREELKEQAAYLNPVQRAQYFMMREKLLERIRQARDNGPDHRGRDGDRPDRGPPDQP
ncbi:MAG TPA: Spy/CpxP family protein refolding chaperone [Gemmatimonadales bacterium]|nr:Spy/CpxP family protein refolding chaperone [Gemmatimonadales bacterium]